MNCENNSVFSTSDKKALTHSHTKIKALSQGQQEFLILERELKPGKRVYLLDEVLSSLDTNHRKTIIKLISNLSTKALVVVISHDVNIQNIADYIYRLDKGVLSQLKEPAISADEITEIHFDSKIKADSFHSFLFLFKKLYFHNFFYHFLNTFICTLFLSLIFLGNFSCQSDTAFALNSALENQDTILFSERVGITNKEVLEKFPDNAFLSVGDNDSSLVISEKVKDDGKVHCNKYMADHKSVYQYNDKFSLDIEVDDTLVDSLFFINPVSWNSFFEQIKSESSNLNFLSLSNCVWNTDSHNANYNQQIVNSGSDLTFIDDDAYEYLFKKELGFVIEENTIYTDVSELSVSHKTDFDSPVYYSKNDQPLVDMNKAYPDGVNIKTLPAGTLHLTSEQSYVLVSDKDYANINSQPRGGSTIVFSLATNKTSIVRFLSKNNFSINSTDYLQTDKNELFKKYNQICSFKTNKANVIPYSILSCSCTAFLIILQFISAAFTKERSLKDDRILDSKGYSSVFRSLLLTLGPLIDLLISLILGDFLARLFSSISSGNSIGFFYFTLFSYGIPWMIILILIISVPSFLFTMHKRKNN